MFLVSHERCTLFEGLITYKCIIFCCAICYIFFLWGLRWTYPGLSRVGSMVFPHRSGCVARCCLTTEADPIVDVSVSLLRQSLEILIIKRELETQKPKVSQKLLLERHEQHKTRILLRLRTKSCLLHSKTTQRDLRFSSLGDFVYSFSKRKALVLLYWPLSLGICKKHLQIT